MDASAYLRKQGWQGDGHSLDHTGRGIRKPLLISKKIDVLGVGLNKHAAVSDQWWLRAFDQGLKDFGTGKKGLLSQVKERGVSRGGLYGRFVKGEEVPGTIGTPLMESTPVDSLGSTETESGGEEIGVGKGERKSKGKKGSKKVKTTVVGLDSAVDAQKLARYKRRAQRKGLSVEDYLSRRDGKRAAKKRASKKKALKPK